MRRPLRLENTVQRYAWGSRDAIPRLVGAAPDGEPWAELWLGAHPSAPSRAVGGMPLDQLIAAEPGELIGARVAARFGPRLPFLFKILAAARPLSIQCHPDADQARAGFARENQRGMAPDARERNYRDDSHKPELVAALDRFEALVGFRSPLAIRDAMARAAPRALAGEIPLLEREGGLAAFVAALLRLPADRRRALVAETTAALASDPSREAAWVRRLAADFPADPGVLAPLFLHRVELAADQALYLGPGVLHSYLAGTGLEIMASSDNVLRGGLTDKHVDVDELLAVLRFEPQVPEVISPESADGRLFAYLTPASEFRLAFVELDAGAYRCAAPGPAIALCLGRRCRIRADSAVGLELARGQAAFIPAALDAIRLEGEGRVYLATVPDGPPVADQPARMP
jgi:mannose-6-phosphate isomerase